jgi:hypothetical protein
MPASNPAFGSAVELIESRPAECSEFNFQIVFWASAGAANPATSIVANANWLTLFFIFFSSCNGSHKAPNYLDVSGNRSVSTSIEYKLQSQPAGRAWTRGEKEAASALFLN